MPEQNSLYFRIGIVTVFIVNVFSDEYIEMQNFRRGDIMESFDSEEQFEENDDDNNEQRHTKYALNCSICGIPQEGDSLVPCIYQGATVKPHNKYPWKAAIYDTELKMKICGAAIISEHYILTAAHCLMSDEAVNKIGPDNCKNPFNQTIPCYRNPSDFRVKLLTKDVKVFVRKRIDMIIPHPKYDIKDYPMHDICILKLQQPIRCNEFRLPICLPSAAYKFSPQREYIFLGWGAKSPNVLWSEKLQQMSLKITSTDECVEKISERKKQPLKRDDINYFYCMLGLGSSSSCNGDSGGIAFAPIGKKMYAMSILSSHTSPYCDPKKPAFAVSIAGHMRWIRKVTGLSPLKKTRCTLYGSQCMKFC